jgi:hypothetical protein
VPLELREASPLGWMLGCGRRYDSDLAPPIHGEPSRDGQSDGGHLSNSGRSARQVRGVVDVEAADGWLLGRAREPAADGADVQQDSDDQSGIGNRELHRGHLLRLGGPHRGATIRECPLRLGLWVPTINTDR